MFCCLLVTDCKSRLRHHRGLVALTRKRTRFFSQTFISWEYYHTCHKRYFTRGTSNEFLFVRMVFCCCVAHRDIRTRNGENQDILFIGFIIATTTLNREISCRFNTMLFCQSDRFLSLFRYLWNSLWFVKLHGPCHDFLRWPPQHKIPQWMHTNAKFITLLIRSVWQESRRTTTPTYTHTHIQWLNSS